MVNLADIGKARWESWSEAKNAHAAQGLAATPSALIDDLINLHRRGPAKKVYPRHSLVQRQDCTLEVLFGRVPYADAPKSSKDRSDPVEELWWDAKSVLWLRGAAVYRSFSFDERDETIIQACLVAFQDIDNGQRGLFVLHESRASFYPQSGGVHLVSLPFPVERVFEAAAFGDSFSPSEDAQDIEARFSVDTGLLVQCASPSGSSPIFYTLMHLHGDLKPLFEFTSGSFFSDANERIIMAKECLFVTVNLKSGIVSLWRLFPKAGITGYLFQLSHSETNENVIRRKVSGQPPESISKFRVKSLSLGNPPLQNRHSSLLTARPSAAKALSGSWTGPPAKSSLQRASLSIQRVTSMNSGDSPSLSRGPDTSWSSLPYSPVPSQANNSRLHLSGSPFSTSMSQKDLLTLPKDENSYIMVQMTKMQIPIAGKPLDECYIDAQFFNERDTGSSYTVSLALLVDETLTLIDVDFPAPQKNDSRSFRSWIHFLQENYHVPRSARIARLIPGVAAIAATQSSRSQSHDLAIFTLSGSVYLATDSSESVWKVMSAPNTAPVADPAHAGKKPRFSHSESAQAPTPLTNGLDIFISLPSHDIVFLNLASFPDSAVLCLQALSHALSVQNFAELQESLWGRLQSAAVQPKVSYFETWVFSMVAQILLPSLQPETKKQSAFDTLCGDVLSDRYVPSRAPFKSLNLSQASRFRCLQALHLSSESLKLFPSRANTYNALVRMLCVPLATSVTAAAYLAYYSRYGFSVSENQSKPSRWDPPLDIVSQISAILAGDVSGDFSFFSLDSLKTAASFYTKVDLWAEASDVIRAVGMLSLSIRSKSFHAFVQHIFTNGWTHESISQLAPSLNIMFQQALRLCQLNPEGTLSAPGPGCQWTAGLLSFIGRPDKAKIVEMCDPSFRVEAHGPQLSVAKFSHDQRFVEALRMLQCTEPRTFPREYRLLATATVELDSLDPELISDAVLANMAPDDLKLRTWAALTLLSNRTLALPIGLSIADYASSSAEEAFDERRDDVGSNSSLLISVPSVCLAARILPDPTVTPYEVPLDAPSNFLAERTDWPHFHMGVRSVLRLRKYSDRLVNANIARPTHFTSKHAGVLFGLGLRGSLSGMQPIEAYTFLKEKHELTSIGLLLGLGVSNLGCGESLISKLASVHIKALTTQGSIKRGNRGDSARSRAGVSFSGPALFSAPTASGTSANHEESVIQVSDSVEAAAMVSLGFMHISSAKRSLINLFLDELIACRTTPIDHPNAQTESKIMAAGIACGLVLLGVGGSPKAANVNANPASFDASMLLPILKQLMQSHALPTDIDTHLTSPAAAVTLMLSYMRTNSAEVASLLDNSGLSSSELDSIEPHTLTIRAIGKAVIMFDEIEPTTEWLKAQLPAIYASQLRREIPVVQLANISSPFWAIFSGACFALALKYAGTANPRAFSVFWSITEALHDILADTKCRSFNDVVIRSTMRNALVMCLAAGSIIYAGTGHVLIMRQIRLAYGLVDKLYHFRYGHHMIISMALGILFMGHGRYSFAKTDLSLASLILAFLPILPVYPSDSRGYLEPLRHLWALAAQPRCLSARDIVTGEEVYLPIQLVTQDGKTSTLVCPTLIPNVRDIVSITVENPRYWPYTLHIAGNPSLERALTNHLTLFVMRRPGQFSYQDDPKGIRTTLVLLSTSRKINDLGFTGATPNWDHLHLFIQKSVASSSLSALLPRRGRQTMSSLESFCTMMLCECITRDKQVLIPAFLSIFASMAKLEEAVEAAREPTTGTSFVHPSVFVFLEHLATLETFYNIADFKALGQLQMPVAPGGHQTLTEPLVSNVFLRYLNLKLREYMRKLPPPDLRRFFGDMFLFIPRNMASSLWLALARAPPVSALSDLVALLTEHEIHFSEMVKNVLSKKGYCLWDSDLDDLLKHTISGASSDDVAIADNEGA